MAVFTETVELKDNVSGAAEKAAQQMELLQSAVTATENALLKASATGNVKKYQSMAKDLTALKASMSLIEPEATKYTQAQTAMTAAEKQRTDGLKKAKDEQEKTQKSMDERMDAAANAMKIGKESIGASVDGIKNAFSSLAQGDVQGAVQGVTESVANLSKLLDLVVPGLGEAVSLVITMAGGLVGITAGLVVAGAKFAIESNQAKKAMIGMFDAMGGKGAELDDMLSGMADKIGISKDILAPMTQDFLQMGVTGTDALQKLTLAAISANAITGNPEAAKNFENLTKKIQIAAQTGQQLKIPLKGLGSLAEMGLKVDDVATQMGVSANKLSSELKSGSVDAAKFGDALQNALIAKGAGPLDRMGSSFDNIKKKFMQDIGDMFEDIDVGPFMEQVKSLFQIFGQAKPSGEALKSGIGGFFKEVFATATQVVPMVKHFLLDLVIYGLKAYIALKPIIATVKEVGNAILANQPLMDGFKMVLLAAGIAIGILVVGAVATAAAVAALVAACIALQVAIVGVGIYIFGLVNQAGAALRDWVAGAATAAYDFVAGLVQGIVNGGAQVAQAVTGLATSAKNAFTSALGIKSPSRVMMEHGENLGEGAAIGVENTHADMAQAAQGLAAAGSGGFAGAGSSSGGGGSGANITFEAGSIVIDGAGKSASEITEEMIALVFEKIALAQGLAA